jgi:hypothetical protein
VAVFVTDIVSHFRSDFRFDFVSAYAAITAKPTNATTAERVSDIDNGADAMQGLPHQQNSTAASIPRQVLRRP